MAEERPVQIIPDPSLSSPRVYSNYVQVSLSPLDCTLTFCEVVGPQNEEEALKMQKSGTLPAPIKTVVVIPVQVVEGLIAALQAQLGRQGAGHPPVTGTTIQ